MSRRALEVTNFYETQRQDTIQFAPVVHPSEEEFKNFKEYMAKLEKQYEKTHGIVKIVPPPSWKPRSTPYDYQLKNLVIKNPIEQNAEGSGGVYELKHVSVDSITYDNYVKANLDQDQIIKDKSTRQLEQLFWKSIAYSPPVYGADNNGTLMDESSGQWNLDNLDTILRQVFKHKLKGVTSSYCYLGSWKSLFCWHIQDLDLSAINYLHQGKSKFWYGIQPQDGIFLQQKAKKQFYISYSKCPQYLRHKTILINPYLLKKQYPEMKISKVQQKPGEFVVAFSKAYHCGFNTGLNIAEAVNFATYKWVENIRYLKCCYCRKSSIKATYENLISILDENQSIRENPQYQAIINQQQQLTRNDRQCVKNEQKKMMQKTKNIKKQAKKDKNRKKLVICLTCEAERMISTDLQNLKLTNFVCKQIGKKCQKKKIKRQDEEYKP